MISARLGPLVLAIAALGALVVAPVRASAGVPTETLRPAIDQVLRILKDPALQGPAHTRERRAAIRAVMVTVIDFREAGRRALGVHWQARTDAERAQFVALFRDLVTASYAATLEGYSGERVEFVGEIEDDGVATVSTRVERRQGPPVPIAYRMHRPANRWLVYDVIVEGTSLVANYREQFNTVVRTASYEELVRRIKARVAELTGAPEVPAVITPCDHSASPPCARIGSTRG